MRIYLVILSDIPTHEGDRKFGEFVQNSNFEFWRYTTLNWILVTPDTVSTNQLLHEVTKCYGPIFVFVLEITIKDFAGISTEQFPGMNPVAPGLWFEKLADPAYAPKWVRDPKTKTPETASVK